MGPPAGSARWRCRCYPRGAPKSPPSLGRHAWPDVCRLAPPRFSMAPSSRSRRSAARSMRRSILPRGTMICARPLLAEWRSGPCDAVHPMLGNFDCNGWVRGAWKSFAEKKTHRTALPKGTRNYAWTLFRPEPAALSDLAQLVEQQRLSLPVAIRKPLDQAERGFRAHQKRPAWAERFLRHDASGAILVRYRAVGRVSPGSYLCAADVSRFRCINAS